MVPKLAAKGTSFKGAAAYYLHDKGASTSERIAWTETVNLATDNPEVAWRIMAATAKDQARLKDQAGIAATGRKSADVVLAYSLSWHPDEKQELTREEMMLAAHASLKSLGADHCQALIVAHQDEPHPHVHVILNRVSPEDGRMLSSSKEKLNLSRWAEAYERGRGKIFCEERVANNQAREMLGEFTRATKDKSRNRYDADKAGAGARPGESPHVTRLRDEQRAKDAALGAKGRDMHDRQRAAWAELRQAHRQRREAIVVETKTAIGRVRADMRASALPLWRQMHKRHFAEQRLFKEREQRVTGKIKNAIAAIKSMGAVRGDANGRGFLGNAFNYLTSASQREKAVIQRHQAEKRAFVTTQRREVSAKATSFRALQKDRLRENVHHLDQDRKVLGVSHDQERHALKSEWRDRNQERADAWSKIRASHDLRRQVAERFTPKDRNPNGPDRGR